MMPKWKCIAQLGDVNPLDYGGYWIFVDEDGEFAPQGEKLFIDEENDLNLAYRFNLDQLTQEILRPGAEFKPWFSDRLHEVASFVGQSRDEIVKAICSDDIVARARAWEAIGSYFGFDNLDSYPLTMSRGELTRRYNLNKYKVMK